MNGRAGLLVAGFCPMGCGETLCLDGAGRVVCHVLPCPLPDAAHRVLADPETEHVVRLRAGDFVIQHPLRERLEGVAKDCEVLERIMGLDRPMGPAVLATYRVRVLTHGAGSDLTWERL